MEKNNSKNDDDNNSIHNSFISLVNLINKGKQNNKKEIQEKIENKIEKEKGKQKEIEIKNNDDNFSKEFFCCKDCYDKFIKVIEKLKNNQVDLTKIDWGKYSLDSSNIIVKLVTYYYNLGLQNSNK